MPATIAMTNVDGTIPGSIPHLGGQGKLLSSLGFQPTYANLFIGPVHVIESQPADLSYTQTIYRQEQNDYTVANMTRTLCVEIGNQTLDLFPAWTFWETSH